MPYLYSTILIGLLYLSYASHSCSTRLINHYCYLRASSNGDLVLFILLLYYACHSYDTDCSSMLLLVSDFRLMGFGTHFPYCYILPLFSLNKILSTFSAHCSYFYTGCRLYGQYILCNYKTRENARTCHCSVNEFVDAIVQYMCSSGLNLNSRINRIFNTSTNVH